MANVYVGFHDQRNSSRILKPPGGGTSNIFGTDLIPDVVPQNSPRKETKQSGSSIQDVIQTETVTTTVTRSEAKSSSSNGTVFVEENQTCQLNCNGKQTNENSGSCDLVAYQQEDANSTPDVAAEVTCKVEQLNIQERSSKSEVTETDSSGNTKVISSESNSDGSVEHNSSFNKGSSIADILNEGDLLEKKKAKGQPAQRVPPGGYSSGLW